MNKRSRIFDYCFSINLFAATRFFEGRGRWADHGWRLSECKCSSAIKVTKG